MAQRHAYLHGAAIDRRALATALQVAVGMRAMARSRVSGRWPSLVEVYPARHFR